MCIKFLLISMLLLSMTLIKEVHSDPACDAIQIDAITDLQNGTIVLFDRSKLWFFHRDKQLIGPCPISQIFEEMKGPIDSAVTITQHHSVTEFVGSSIYFEKGNYSTYRNLGKYNVEWGSLIYLPHKGIQSKMGATVPAALEIMSSTMSAAYFDPNDAKTKFIFPDGSVLAFTFELGVEYDKPSFSNINNELDKYGVKNVPQNISAALTLTTGLENELFLFKGHNYCSLKMTSGMTDQKCKFKPIKEGFLKCDSIERTNGFCTKPNKDQLITEAQTESHTESVVPENRIVSQLDKEENKKQDVIGRNFGNVRDNDNNSTSINTTKSGAAIIPIQSILNFVSLLLIIIIY